MYCKRFCNRDSTILINGHSFQIIAQDNPIAGPSHSSTASFLLHLRDINDNPPTFDLDLYSFKVNEVTAVNSPIGTVHATDQDNHGPNSLQYFIVPSGVNDFYVDRLTGELYTGNSLDRERKDEYIFEVMVTDSGSLDPLQGYARVNVTIEDSNDNAPKFATEDMVFYVEENQPMGVEVGQVVVTDPDSGKGGEVELIMLTEGEGGFIDLDATFI